MKIDTDKETMRIGELAERSQIPKSTIHYYLREQLLHQPEKPTQNSAIYSSIHLDRLHLIKKLRSDVLGPLPIPQIRRVLQLLDEGVSLDIAVELQRAVVDGLSVTGNNQFTLEQLVQESELPIETVHELIEAGVLLPNPMKTAWVFDAADVRVAKALTRLLSTTSINIQDLALGAKKIRDLSKYGMMLRNRAVSGLDANECAHVALMLQETDNLIRRYLFIRARQYDICELAETVNK